MAKAYTEILEEIAEDRIRSLVRGDENSQRPITHLPYPLAGKYLARLLQRRSEEIGIPIHIDYDPKKDFSVLQVSIQKQDLPYTERERRIAEQGYALGMSIGATMMQGFPSATLKGDLARLKDIELFLPYLRELPSDTKGLIPLRGFGAPTPRAPESKELKESGPLFAPSFREGDRR
jgi:hypothetical protein